jgi:pimeloyl-ACP methyl ester carboxylesterase
MTLVSKTYWLGAPYFWKSPPRDANLESLILRSADHRQIHGLYWTPRTEPSPRIAVVLMHPRVDFSHHYSIPRLIDVGIGCLTANTRNPNNDVTTVHEEIILDAGACVTYLKEQRGVEHVVLIGNSGGGSLFSFYQSQAERPPAERIALTPGGRPTALPAVEMLPADGLILISAHKGQGMVMNECIDPAVLDESRPQESEASLDMYDSRNGFRPAPEWSEYAPAFALRYRAAQLARVQRLDDTAKGLIADNRAAAERQESPEFASLDTDAQHDVLRREAFEPVMTIHRSMANLHYVDRHLDPSPREYGSLLSDRPDLMNQQILGFGRLCSPHAWLSTWSGCSSNANLLKTLPGVEVPTLVINAGRDREIYPEVDARPIFEAVGAEDRTFLSFDDARHYFEPDFGAQEAPDVKRLMDRVIPWIAERFEGARDAAGR